VSAIYFLNELLKKNLFEMRNNYHGITAGTLPIPTAVPWTWYPCPRCYRELCPRYRGITAVLPASPFPRTALLFTRLSWRRAMRLPCIATSVRDWRDLCGLRADLLC